MQSTSAIPEPSEPENLKEALSSQDAAFWKLAVEDEYNSLISITRPGH
jgi:hypothetical protein